LSGDNGITWVIESSFLLPPLSVLPNAHRRKEENCPWSKVANLKSSHFHEHLHQEGKLWFIKRIEAGSPWLPSGALNSMLLLQYWMKKTYKYVPK